jgi:hypothetical protein
MADVQKIVDDLSALTITEAAELAEMLKAKWNTVPGPERSVLFEDRERTRTEPLRRGEQLFDFYDSSASPGYNELRAVVNGWLAQMPADDCSELIARMRYGGDREFGAALSELSTQALVVGSGFQVRPHPQVPESTKRPDFAAIGQANAPEAYVEVTTVNPPATEEAEKNRENPIYNAINGAKIPAGSILGYRLARAGKNSPPLRSLLADVERWARDNAEAAKTKEVSKAFAAGDWIIELDLYSGGGDPNPPTEAIGVAQMRGGVITPHKDLRDALYEKSRRYGALDKPYLIAVADGKNQLFSKDSIHSALTDAVFGDEIMQFNGGTAHIIRAKNGFWHGPNEPRNKHVSAVLLLPETGLWKLREEKWQPVLAINPWADHPLPDALREMDRFEADDGKWVFKGGKQFADIIGLPDPWPPAEQ